jgi:hypothetical protein
MGKQSIPALGSSPLIQNQGWDACVESKFLRATDDWRNAQESRSHLHVFRRLFEELEIDALLCVDGRPSVCVKDARHMDFKAVEALRHSLWNLSATTLLLAEGASEIRVFSTLAKPDKNDASGTNALLSEETLASLADVELTLRLRQFVRRVETGLIYRGKNNSLLFAQSGAVDQFLLSNLKATRDLLCPEKNKKRYQRAHALIGRFLFSCYLFDRGIIDTAYLAKKRLPEAGDMLGLLRAAKQEERAGILKTLFDVLQRDFNGSLFGETLDIDSITNLEVGLLLRFLAGEDVKTGQQSLFKLYDFSFIPVELISSIYEEFLAAEASFDKATNSSSQSEKTDRQRVEGAYYTPPRLAELTVDIATRDWTTLLDKRCLDPACGSGVFLVILFIRMAEEWRKCHPKADTQERYESLLALLGNNIRGTDINPTACLVACFSLYLAFLDQMEPRAIVELRDVLNKTGNSKILPRILWLKDNPAPKPPHSQTIREENFFDLSPDEKYDLVIGNPPWVSRRKKELASQNIEAWLLDSSKNPYLESVAKAVRTETFFPAGEFATAFMWKSGLHLCPAGGERGKVAAAKVGRVCQILPTRSLIANQVDRFQEAWLQHHRLESVWLLADWRRILFPSADCPCFVASYHPRAEGEAFGEFEFVTPKVELIDPREALLPVSPEDQKTLWESYILDAAKRNESAFAWKKNHWGTPRDARLLDRLMQAPRLSAIAKEPPDTEIPDAQRKRRWYKGQGFQPASRSTIDLLPAFWKKTDLFLDARIKDINLLLLPSDCKKIGDRFQGGLHRKRSTLIYQNPLLLINKGCTKFLYSDFSVLFKDAFQAICAPKSEEDELLFLTAYLASPLSQYLLFHTTANIGIERDIARIEEILELPFPLPENTSDPVKKQEIITSCAKALRNLRRTLSAEANLLRRDSLVQVAQEELNEAVYAYFGISRWEQELIEDTVRIFRPSSAPPSFESPKLITAPFSRPEHREDYARTLARTFRAWTRRTGKQISVQGLIVKKTGLAVLTLVAGDSNFVYSEKDATVQVEGLLDRIRTACAHNTGTLFKPLRGFAFYEPDRVHILKPLARRYWTRTAALNDADEIVAHMMEENGWQ